MPQARKSQSKFETSPERVALIKDVISAVIATGGHLVQDAICQDEDVRELATRLGLPYLEMQIIVNGPTPLSATDVDDAGDGADDAFNPFLADAGGPVAATPDADEVDSRP
jgi:hypothetical protein